MARWIMLNKKIGAKRCRKVTAARQSALRAKETVA
jgi:hypothetical protein